MILRATLSAAGLLWLLGVAIWGARCLRFDILGDHLAAGWTRGGPEQDFNRLLGWLWDPCVLAFWFQGAWNFTYFPGSCVLAYCFLNRNISTPRTPNASFWLGKYCKNQLLSQSVFYGCRGRVVSIFWSPWELFFFLFVWWINVWKHMVFFFVCKRILRSESGKADQRPIWALKTVNSIAW